MPCRSNSAQAKSSPRTPNSCLNSVDGIAHPRSEACVHRPQIVRGHQTCGKSPPKGCGKDRRKRQADVSTNVSTAAVSMVGMCSCRHQASSWVRRAAASSITLRINKRAKEYKIPRRVLHSDYINATCPEWPRIPATWPVRALSLVRLRRRLVYDRLLPPALPSLTISPSGTVSWIPSMFKHLSCFHVALAVPRWPIRLPLIR
jgi:hypothetical protein